MSVVVADLLAHSNHGTAWPFGFCQARDAFVGGRGGAAAP